MATKGREAVYAECDEWGEERVQEYIDTHPDDPERVHRLEWLNIKARAERKQLVDGDWAALPPEIRRAIEAGWQDGMPPMASALYARWWQLETWLRSLIYVELRSALGSAWFQAVSKAGSSESRQLVDRQFRYMATPDAQNRLAYTDASVLFRTTQEHWDFFEHALLAKNVWAGRIDELLAIRNRIGHCRRPHADDLVRLEQTLRDLENGAFVAASAFNRHWRPNEKWTDAVTDGWVRANHSDAMRLVEHAERQYETSFDLRFSRRPWAGSHTWKETVTGKPGYVWHASWFFRNRSPDLGRFWRDLEPYHETILMVCSDGPSSVEVSFAAVEDSNVVADAIGRCFDAALMNLDMTVSYDYIRWRNRFADLDPRVHVGTAWSLVDDSMERYGVSIFSAN